MSDNLNVKAVSNLYTNLNLHGQWLCVGCVASISVGDFTVFNGPCCRFPDFSTDTLGLKKGMNSTDERGKVHTIRRCAGCLVAGKACVAPPEDVEDDLKLIKNQLDIIYDSTQSSNHGEAKATAMRLALALKGKLNRVPYAPHHVFLRLHNGATHPDNSPLSAVRLNDTSKSRVARNAKSEAEKAHTGLLVSERLENLQSSPSGRGHKRRYDDTAATEALDKARTAENEAKDALREHMATSRGIAARAGKTWDAKTDKLQKALDSARLQVKELARLI